MPYVTSIERRAKEEGREEGWTQGLEKGREQGREQGRSELVLRLVRRRWEILPAALEEPIRVLSLEQLANLAEALSDFTSNEDLEKWLAGHGSRGE